MSNADKLTDFAITKLNSIFDAVHKTMPTMIKYTLEVTSMTCLINVITLLLLIIIPIILGFCSKWLWDKYEDQGGDWNVVAGFFTVFTIVTFIVWFINVLYSIWDVIGIFHPDLYLIHLALEKVTR